MNKDDSEATVKIFVIVLKASALAVISPAKLVALPSVGRVAE